MVHNQLLILNLRITSIRWWTSLGFFFFMFKVFFHDHEYKSELSLSQTAVGLNIWERERESKLVENQQNRIFITINLIDGRCKCSKIQGRWWHTKDLSCNLCESIYSIQLFIQWFMCFESCNFFCIYFSKFFSKQILLFTLYNYLHV